MINDILAQKCTYTVDTNSYIRHSPEEIVNVVIRITVFWKVPIFNFDSACQELFTFIQVGSGYTLQTHSL